MSAVVKVLTQEQHEALRSVFDGDDGAVLLTPAIAGQIAKDAGIEKEELDGLFLPEYDYFGEPDVVYDLVSSDGHLACDAIRKELSGE